VKIDKKKIEWLASLEPGSLAFYQKYRLTSQREVAGFTFNPNWDHWIHTLRAHANGRIHSTKIGKYCTYEAPKPREKGSGQTYPLVSKEYYITINTLEEQEAFIGKKLMELVSRDSAQDIAAAP